MEIEAERSKVLSREDINPPTPEDWLQETKEFRNQHIRQTHTLIWEGIQLILHSIPNLN